MRLNCAAPLNLSKSYGFLSSLTGRRGVSCRPMKNLHEMWRTRSGAFGLILLAALLYWGGEYLRRDLWAPDEARFAYVAREMRETGEWLVPHRHGEYYAHKPPLMFWMINGAATVFTGGEISAFATRLPSLLGGVAALWSVVMLMRLWGRREHDLAAAAVCAATFLFWKQGGWGQIDMLLCGLEMLAVLALFSQDRTPSFPRAFAAYACMGLAILAKGPVGFLVPLGAYVTAKLAAGEKADLRRTHFLWGPLVTLAFPGIWLLLVKLGHPPEGYLQELLFKQNVERAQGEYGHRNPFYYFLLTFPMDALPWSLLLPFAWRAMGATPEDRAFRRRILGWIGFVIFLFSLSPGKRNLYILLVYPAAALLTAAAWARTRGRREEVMAAILSRVPQVLFAVLTLACVASVWLPALARWVSDSTLRRKARYLEQIALIDDMNLVRVAGETMLIFIWLLVLRRVVTRRVGAMWGIAAAWGLCFAAAGALVMPVFNEVKTPRELVPIVADHLPAGQRLHLYQMNGENLTLYTRTIGRVLYMPEEVAAVLKRRPAGLIIFEENKLDQIPADLLARFDPHPFRLGGKRLIAASWPRP